MVLAGVPSTLAMPWARVGISASGPLAEAVREGRLVWVGAEGELARRYPRIGLALPYSFALAAPVVSAQRTWGGLLLWAGLPSAGDRAAAATGDREGLRIRRRGPAPGGGERPSDRGHPRTAHRAGATTAYGHAGRVAGGGRLHREAPRGLLRARPRRTDRFHHPQRGGPGRQQRPGAAGDQALGGAALAGRPRVRGPLPVGRDKPPRSRGARRAGRPTARTTRRCSCCASRRRGHAGGGRRAAPGRVTGGSSRRNRRRPAARRPWWPRRRTS